MAEVGVYGKPGFGEDPSCMAVSAEKKRDAGLRLKAARIALGYDQRRGRNQTAFYELFGFTIGRGNNWERGVSYPYPEFMVALCERFDVGPDWILVGRPGSLPYRLANEVVDNFNKLKG